MKQATSDSLTLRHVLSDLARHGVVDENTLPQIEQYLAKTEPPRSEPWFVKFLLGVGAWVAAICFVAFLSIAIDIFDDSIWLFSFGAVFIVAATFLRRVTRHVFLVQLALALSAAGHFFILLGVAETSPPIGEPAAIAIAAILLCLVLYPLYADSLHRFLSCLLAASCVTVWIVVDEVWPVIHVEMLSKIVAIGIVFMYRPDLHMLRPLGYAMAISVPASLFLVLLPEDVFAVTWWPASVILALALIWLYQWVVGGWQNMQSEPMLLAAAATIGLASFTTPGILAAIGLMVLGYARGDMHLTGIGVAFFPVFIVVFYYELEISLLVKSWIMAGSGVVLLAVRWYLGLRGWAQETNL